jgi:lincosamide nucleotidyltransferase A/C/D/E
MKEPAVIELLRALAERQISVWVAGGWAADAVVGRQTRAHGDLDLAVDAAHLEDVMALLDELGFSVTVDWLPARVELTAQDGRRVDLHPVRFAIDGSGSQAGLAGASFHYAADAFSQGVIAGYAVPCLGAQQQLRFREGYELREVDRHDLELLRHHAPEPPRSTERES